jgi:hypothetical protein
MSLSLIEKGLWFGSIALQVAVACRLVSIGLARTYRLFCAYLAVASTISILLAAAFPDPGSIRYAFAWMVSRAVSLAAETAAVIELLLLALRRYRGAQGREFIGLLVLAGAAVAIIPLGLDLRYTDWVPAVFPTVLAASRVITACLALIAIGTLVLIWAMAAAPRPNTVVHARLFAVFASCQAAAFFAANAPIGNVIALNIFLLAASCSCLIGWIALLKPRGEEIPMAAAMTSEEIDHAMAAEKRVLNEGDRLVSGLMETTFGRFKRRQR